jgi:ABC-2 type transport system permease protein
MNSIIVALNLIRRLTREISVLGFLILFPLLGGILAVAMVGNAAIPVGVANVPPGGHPLVQAIEGNSRYRVRVVAANEVEKLVNNREIRIAVVLPAAGKEGTEKSGKIKLVSRRKDIELMQFEGLAAACMNAVQSGTAVTAVSNDTGNEKNAGSENDAAAPRMAMGFLTMFILLFTGTGMGMILEEKKKKTFMRTFSTPIRGHEIVLGNLLANLLLGLVQIVLFLGATRFILKIDWGVPMLDIFLVLGTFLITAIGMGIGVMGFVRDHQVYSVINSILASLTCMLGGSFFDVNLMSGAFRKAANFLPQKWAMEAFDKLAAGSTLADIQFNLLILLLFGAVFFTFGVKVLRPSVEDL